MPRNVIAADVVNPEATITSRNIRGSRAKEGHETIQEADTYWKSEGALQTRTRLLAGRK
jgi:hypothetical protein